MGGGLTAGRATGCRRGLDLGDLGDLGSGVTSWRRSRSSRDESRRGRRWGQRWPVAGEVRINMCRQVCGQHYTSTKMVFSYSF